MKKLETTIDATDRILGRLSSDVAKKLLKGYKITIINAEKAVVTGEPKMIMKRFRTKIERGDPHHGPYYPKRPAGIIKRSVRGMLPYKKTKGRDALKRLKVYSANPENLKADKNDKGLGDLECRFIRLEKITEKVRGA